MLEMFIMVFFMVLLFLIYFVVKYKYLTTVEIRNFASAGSSDYEQDNIIQAKIPNKMITVAKNENLTLVKVIGNSAQQTGIKNNNIVAIKMTNNIEDVKKGDVIYLKYNKYPKKFKLREYIESDNDNGTIKSQTLNNGIMNISNHKITDLKGVVKYNTIPL